MFTVKFSGVRKFRNFTVHIHYSFYFFSLKHTLWVLVISLFVWVEALHPSKHFSVMSGRFLWLNQNYISNEDEVSCSRTQHSATGEIHSGTLPTELMVLPILVIEVVLTVPTIHLTVITITVCYISMFM